MVENRDGEKKCPVYDSAAATRKNLSLMLAAVLVTDPAGLALSGRF